MVFVEATCDFTTQSFSSSDNGFKPETLQSLLEDFRQQEERLKSHIVENEEGLTDEESMVIYSAQCVNKSDDVEASHNNEIFSEEFEYSFPSTAGSTSSSVSLTFNNHTKQRSHHLDTDIFGIFRVADFLNESQMVSTIDSTDEDEQEKGLRLWSPSSLEDSTVAFDLVLKEQLLSTSSVRQRVSLKIPSIKKKKKKGRSRLAVSRPPFSTCSNTLQQQQQQTMMSVNGQDDEHRRHGFNNNISNNFNRNDGNILKSVLPTHSKVELRSWFFEDIETNNIVTPLFRILKHHMSNSSLILSSTAKNESRQLPFCTRHQLPYCTSLYQSSPPSSFRLSHSPHHHHHHSTLLHSSFPFFSLSRSHSNNLSLAFLNIANLNPKLFKARRSSSSKIRIVPSLRNSIMNRHLSSQLLTCCFYGQSLLPQLSVPRGLNYAPINNTTPSLIYRGKRPSPKHLDHPSFRNSSVEETLDEEVRSPRLQLKRRRLCPRSLTVRSQQRIAGPIIGGT